MTGSSTRSSDFMKWCFLIRTLTISSFKLTH